MYQRKRSETQIFLEDGTAVTAVLLNGQLIEDLMLLHAHARGFQEVTGITKAAEIRRDTKDVLLRLYTIN